MAIFAKITFLRCGNVLYLITLFNMLTKYYPDTSEAYNGPTGLPLGLEYAYNWLDPPENVVFPFTCCNGMTVSFTNTKESS